MIESNMQNTAKVFVTQEVSFANYAGAQEFGDVVFLTASEVSMVDESLHNAKLVDSIRRRLAGYSPELDYIAPSGSPVITGLVFAILAERTSRFKILKWNGRDRAYSPVTIDISKVVL